MTKHIFIFVILYVISIHAQYKDIIISGNSSFSTERLQELMSLPDEFPDRLNESRQKLFLTLAQASLEQFYEEKGYFNISITLGDTLVENKSKKKHHIEITEGLLFKYSDVEIDIPNTDKLLLKYEDLHIYPLKQFNIEDISADLSLISKRYRGNGYLHVTAQHIAIIDTLKNSIKIVYRINPGNLVKFGTLKISSKRSNQYREHSGTTKGLTSVPYLKSLWDKKPGEIIDNNYLDVFRTNLLSTRLFSQVTIRDSIHPDSTHNLSTLYLNTVEKVPGSLKFRLFYEQIYGLGSTGELRYRNFFGRFHEGWISGTYAQNKQRAAIGYANPLLFNLPIRFENELSIQQDNLTFNRSNIDSRETYIVNNRGSISRRFSEYFRLMGSVKLRNQIRYNTTIDTITKKEPEKQTIKFETVSFLDFVDQPISPENGVRLIFTLGNGGEFKLDNRYTYGSIESKFYKRISKHFQIASGIDHGRFFNESFTALDYQTYYQGGDRSIRGLEVGEISPNYTPDTTNSLNTDTTSDQNSVQQEGGQPAYVRAAFEVRITPPSKSLENFQVVPFIDWAIVWDPRPDYKSETGTALGLGLRYRWQVLTIRLDYSFKTDFSKPFSGEPWDSQRLVFDLMQAI
ncbi:MAG: BamA/TamA family outer membrane protein [Fibrobacterales bacterium]